jgi:glycosyltransferase involved in cell wall biosynthesis
MHIGIDATALYGRFGGVEYALSNLLQALEQSDLNNQYTIYLPRDAPPGALRGGTAHPRRRRVRLPFAGADKLRRILWQQCELPRRLQRDGCDLLHAPTYVSPLRASVPVVLGAYDLIALAQPHFATRPNRAHYGLLMPRCLRRARRVIVPTEAVRREIARFAPEALAQTRVVPLGVEDEFRRAVSASERDRVRRRYRLPDAFLLFVGNHEPKKNLSSLLRALPLVANVPPLVIAGGVHAWRGYRPAANARVLDLGYVPRHDLPALYGLCRAFVFPTLAEGFGLPVLEALACGAPVVAGKAVPLPTLDNAALLCEAARPAAIARQLQRVLDDAALREKLSRAGREYARPFTWQRSAEMTLDVYREASS